MDKYIVQFCYKEAREETHRREFHLGQNGVINMEYHEPRGEGDNHFVDVYHKGGLKIRVFCPDYISFRKENDPLEYKNREGVND